MAFSLLGELDEDEDEDEEKPTPVRPGGLVAVFCPVRLLRQTGQLSCWRGEERRGGVRGRQKAGPRVQSGSESGNGSSKGQGLS